LDLTKDPVPQLLRNIAIPASIGMFFSTMYYVIDDFYTGMLSSTALAIITIALNIIGTSILGVWWSIAIATWTTATVQFFHMRNLVRKQYYS
jgi:Na+-driven multidrug efflux pump